MKFLHSKETQNFNKPTLNPVETFVNNEIAAIPYYCDLFKFFRRMEYLTFETSDVFDSYLMNRNHFLYEKF